jgi:plasmid stabilization system protein ParE
MNLFVRKSPAFQIDVTQQFEWYFDKAGEQLAWRFFTIVDLTLSKLSGQPDLGRLRHFRSPLLRSLRSFRLEPPFQQRLVFYRHKPEELVAERLLHGARDLPRRLVEPNS